MGDNPLDIWSGAITLVTLKGFRSPLSVTKTENTRWGQYARFRREQVARGKDKGCE